jgi:hypothetical protein
MTSRDDDFRIRPGRVRDGDARSFIGQVERAARRAAQGGRGFGALAREVEAERWTGLDVGLRSPPTRAAVSSTYAREARIMIRNCGGYCSDAPQSLNVWVSPSRSDRVVGR